MSIAHSIISQREIHTCSFCYQLERSTHVSTILSAREKYTRVVGGSFFFIIQLERIAKVLESKIQGVFFFFFIYLFFFFLFKYQCRGTRVCRACLILVFMVGCYTVHAQPSQLLRPFAFVNVVFLTLQFLRNPKVVFHP